MWTQQRWPRAFGPPSSRACTWMPSTQKSFGRQADRSRLLRARAPSPGLHEPPGIRAEQRKERLYSRWADIQALAAVVGPLVSMAAEQDRNLSLDSLRQQRSRAFVSWVPLKRKLKAIDTRRMFSTAGQDA